MQEPRYFHIYNRGASKDIVFQDDLDFVHFIRLINRYLGSRIVTNRYYRPYTNYRSRIRLHAYCLLNNHFHFVLEELEAGAMGRFMQSLKGAYCRSFNLRHNRTGVLFETKYQKREVGSTEDLMSVSRYVHLNAVAIQKDYENYRYSSLKYYLYGGAPEWLYIDTIASLFKSPAEYLAFHEDGLRDIAIKALDKIQV